MIAKHIQRSPKLKDDIQNLVEYITDKRGTTERVQDTRITNCMCDDVAAAVLEMQCVQAMNKNKNDKTYHLLISFPKGEKPTKEQLRIIEDEMCEALGYGKHQRISVVHGDTDNLHIHVAINKINPQTYKSHNPLNDFKILRKKRKELEKRFGLKPNLKEEKQEEKTQSNSKADDYEAHTGKESFNSFMKNLIPEIKACKSWSELHEMLAQHGVKLKKRGNGLIFESNEYFVKASSVDREFSKKKLEEKYGAFIASDKEVKKETGYVAEPSEENRKIYEEYQQYKQEQKIKNKKELSDEIKSIVDTSRLFSQQLMREQTDRQIQEMLNTLDSWLTSILIKQAIERKKNEDKRIKNIKSFIREKNKTEKIKTDKRTTKNKNEQYREHIERLEKIKRVVGGRAVYEYIRAKLKLCYQHLNRIPKAIIAQKCMHKLRKRIVERSKRKNRGIL